MLTIMSPLSSALTPWLIVNRTIGHQSTQHDLREFACQGLFSRNESTAVYVLNSGNDLWWLQSTGGAGSVLPPDKTVTEDQFLTMCLSKYNSYVRYNATAQKELLPLFSTIAGAVSDLA